jgi:hypothetical protein
MVHQQDIDQNHPYAKDKKNISFEANKTNLLRKNAGHQDL